MTVSATLPRSQNTITSGNLTSLASDLSSVTFNVTFKYLSTAEVVVTRTDSTGSDTELTETTHYTISPSAGDTGTMTFTATGRDLFSADDLLTFTRRMEKAATTFDQLTDYTQNDALDADTLEGNFDKSIMISQQIAERSSRQLAFAATATFDTTATKASTITGTASSRQNKLLGFDSAGDISATQDIGTYKGTSATTTTSDYNIRDIVKSSTAGQLNNVYICKKASPSGTALTNTTYWDIIIDAYAASSSATTATNKATEASRSEDNAEAYANTAAETAVTVFGASNAADPTQSGTTTDGYSSLHHREKAKEWATSSSNITDDSGSAISPAVKSAKTYATEAGTSESNASTSETNAAASATAAAASAAAVANALDSFDDKYLGVMADNASATTATLTGAAAAKDSSSITFTGSSGTITVGQELTSTGTGYPSSANIIGTSTTSPITISAPFTAAISSASLTFTGQGVYGAWDASKDGPSTDNDGNALVNGALYYNSTDGEMRVYDTTSGAWIAASAAQNATVLDYTYTLSGSDATISGSDDNSATLTFSSQESVDVFLNGVKLVPKIGSDANDYHLDTSNTVTLASTAVSGDVILVRVYKTFTVGDAVPASTGGTFSGNVSFGDNNITNVGSIALDSISADATSITISSDMETATNKKIKQKGAFMQSSTHQALTLGY